MRRVSILAVAAAFAGAAALLASGCGRRAGAPEPAAVFSPGPLPTGDDGKLVAYGRDLIERTPQLLPHNVRAGMACEACHLAAGTKAHAGALVGIAAEFPQWNGRSKRFIALQDRLAECFLYSMNGTPPAYDSREMIALTAYIGWLSKGQPIGTKPQGYAYVTFPAPATPDPARGATVYAQRCASCHAADGSGNGSYPPLWGARSFNDGAGMHRLATMAEFVRYNMPFGAPPNTLSAQDAYDVAAFVLSHPRPHFDPTRPIAFPSRPAGFF